MASIVANNHWVETQIEKATEAKWHEMATNGNVDKKTSLTRRQKTALPVVAASPSVLEAARRSNVGLRTLHRRLEDDGFRRELERLQDEAAELARSELQGLMLRSVTVLSEVMKDPSPSIRLRAANSALAFAIKVGENRKLSEELASLEEALPVWAAQHSGPQHST